MFFVSRETFEYNLVKKLNFQHLTQIIKNRNIMEEKGIRNFVNCNADRYLHRILFFKHKVWNILK